MKNATVIIALLAVVLIGVAVMFLPKFLKKKNEPPNDDNDNNNQPANNTRSDSFPLKRGSRGSNVKALQKGLNQKHNAGLNVDGDFGSKTEKAVQQFLNTSEVTVELLNRLYAPDVQTANLATTQNSWLWLANKAATNTGKNFGGR